MDCRNAMSLLPAVLDGEIGPSEMPELWDHLAKCHRCSAELAAMRSVETLVSDLPTISPRSDLSFRILAELGYTSVPMRVRSLIVAACAVVAAWVAGLAIATSVGLVLVSPIRLSSGGLYAACRHLFSFVGKLVELIQTVMNPLIRALFDLTGSCMLGPILLTLTLVALLSKLVYDWTLGRSYGCAVVNGATSVRKIFR